MKSLFNLNVNIYKLSCLILIFCGCKYNNEEIKPSILIFKDEVLVVNTSSNYDFTLTYRILSNRDQLFQSISNVLEVNNKTITTSMYSPGVPADNLDFFVHFIEVHNLDVSTDIVFIKFQRDNTHINSRDIENLFENVISNYSKISFDSLNRLNNGRYLYLVSSLFKDVYVFVVSDSNANELDFIFKEIDEFIDKVISQE